MSLPLRINIVGVDNGAGLTADARLLTGLLQDAGMSVKWSTRSPARWMWHLDRVRALRRAVPRADVNLFLERCNPAWFPFAARNVLIPNPEWFPPEQLDLLCHIDLVLCKTVDSRQIFERLGCRCLWVGFTAHDRGDDALAAASDQLRVLHVAGRSEHKGTSAVLRAWERHPEWPTLTVVRRRLDQSSTLELPLLRNVRYLTERLSDAEILSLQREYPLYLLPSEVEGYGQALVEGMSTGSVVITTDAPPMNEMVRPSRGVLVRANAGEACRLGRLYHVDIDALESVLADVLNWDKQRRADMGASARAWFVQNDQRFRSDFPAALRAVARGI